MCNFESLSLCGEITFFNIDFCFICTNYSFFSDKSESLMCNFESLSLCGEISFFKIVLSLCNFESLSLCGEIFFFKCAIYFISFLNIHPPDISLK